MSNIVRKYDKLSGFFILIFLFAFSSSGFAQPIMTEDYENANFINNYYDYGTQRTRSSAVVHSGNYSMPSNLPQGFYQMRNLPAQPSSTWVWTTFWLYVPSSPTTVGGSMHMVSTNWSGQYCQLDFRSETLKLIVWNDTTMEMDTARNYSYFRGKWTKLQTGIQYSTKSVQVWVDDVKVYDHTNVGDYSTTSQINQIAIRAHQINTTNSMTWYIDDVSVDTGVRPTTTTVPVPPHMLP